MCEGRSTVPWLDLKPNDDLDLAFVFASRGEQRLQDVLDTQRQLRAEE